MNRLISKQIVGYACIILIALSLAAIILYPIVNNFYLLIGVLLIVFIIFLILLLLIDEKFIKPIDKISFTIDKLLEGNYRARISHPTKSSVGELSSKINVLARNLSKLTIQEQIKAEQLTTVIENLDSGIVLIDEKGYIHFMNRKFAQMSGRNLQQYVGYPYYDVIENEDIHRVVQRTFLIEKREKKFIAIENDATPTVYIEVVSAPIFDERDYFKGVVLVVHDITELKKLEMMRKDFVANVSHELKTPITSIRGFAETLIDGAIDDIEMRDYFLQIIYKESKRIQVLIDDLLVLSKIEQDDKHIKIAPMKMGRIIDELMPIFEQGAHNKEIEIQVDIVDDRLIDADSEKIKQLLLNLYTNAINYTPKNGKVTIQVNADDKYLVLHVIDTGIGIEREALPRIFERFYRVDKDRSRKTGGTGLGLAIVKHIVEAHNGKIEVESEVGKGTTFSVYLPLQQELQND